MAYVAVASRQHQDNECLSCSNTEFLALGSAYAECWFALHVCVPAIAHAVSLRLGGLTGAACD